MHKKGTQMKISTRSNGICMKNAVRQLHQFRIDENAISGVNGLLAPVVTDVFQFSNESYHETRFVEVRVQSCRSVSRIITPRRETF